MTTGMLRIPYGGSTNSKSTVYAVAQRLLIRPLLCGARASVALWSFMSPPRPQRPSKSSVDSDRTS